MFEATDANIATSAHRTCRYY